MRAQLPQSRCWAAVGGGTAENMDGVPYVGQYLSELYATGPVRYVYFRYHRGHNVVISGQTSQEAVRAFCSAHSLDFYTYTEWDWSKSVEALGGAPELFATQFSDRDAHVRGHIAGAGILFMSYRYRDGAFCMRVAE